DRRSDLDASPSERTAREREHIHGAPPTDPEASRIMAAPGARRQGLQDAPQTRSSILVRVRFAPCLRTPALATIGPSLGRGLSGGEARMSTIPRVGWQLAGYRIESLIGRGGMSVVYKAHYMRVDWRVALKLLTPL